MSYYTDSAKLQQEVELAIDKRSGRKFGPPQVRYLTPVRTLRPVHGSSPIRFLWGKSLCPSTHQPPHALLTTAPIEHTHTHRATAPSSSSTT